MLRPARGDTIIEVLIAIAVAAFAISTSYAIASRSLQRAIDARERNEGLSLAESQIAGLKTHFKNDSGADFNSQFKVPAAATSPGTYLNFCLDNNSVRQLNSFATPDEAAELNNAGYSSACKRDNGSTTYFVNVSAIITPSSQDLANKTVYKFMVRWPAVGRNQVNSSTIYYRL